MFDKLKKDLLDARKTRDTTKAKFLATLISDCEAQGKKSLRAPTDVECIAIIKSWIKKANETLKSNDNHTTRSEVELLTSYLPRQMSKDEILCRLCEISEAAEAANDVLNMGDYMRCFKERYCGQYDARMLSEIVREFLN